jgi:hypothetical protein
MGLDMYVYRMQKISDEDVAHLLGQHVDTIDGKYTFFSKSDFDERAEMYGDLVPIVTQVEMVQTLFDYKRCFEDNRMNEDDICGSHFSQESVGWMLRDGRHVELTREQYNTYLYEANVDMYVLFGDMVAYWRKSYDLHDFLEKTRVQSRTLDYIAEHQKVPTEDDVASWLTENCGYYELSEREKMALYDWLNKHPDDAQEEEFMELLYNKEAKLFYEAWW